MNRKVLTVCMSLLLVVIPLLAMAAPAAPRAFSPAQKGFAASGENVLPYAPDRILVKFRESSMERSKLDIGFQRGAAAKGVETGFASVDALSGQLGVTKISRPFIQPKNAGEAVRLGVDRWYMFELQRGADIEDVIRRYAADPNVEAATPDWVAFPAVVPSDPLYADSWGHNNTAQLPDLDWGGTYDHTLPNTVGTPGFDANAQGAWDASQGFGSSSVILAIIDSGVDLDHPDLTLVAGYDYGDNDSNPDDNAAGAGHGTCCAGVAAAKVNNGLGACGAAPGVRVMPLKVANSAGTMYFSAIINAIYHAADNGADIISMSLGAAISSDPSTDAAIQYAYNAGVTILAATGNENRSTISYPAINTYVIGVGAASPCGDRKRSSSLSSECNPGVSTDPNGYTCDGERWWGSNYGTNSPDAAGAVDILGPTILPTSDIQGSGGYRSGDYEPFFNGTSCATPYVAGVCALIKSQNPTWTPAQVRSQLVSSAIDIVNVEAGGGWDRYSGYGMVDAEAAVGGGGGPTPPTAAFTGAPTSGDAPLLVSFTDQSSGSPTSWSWNFGDLGTSSAQNPSHTYTSPGTYTVSLTATNAYGSDGETKVDYITVTAPGSGYANLPYSTGFESGALDQYWTTNVTSNGRIRILSTNTPHSGSYHMVMDAITNGTYAQTESWLHVNLAGKSQVDLDFWWKEFGDETHSQDGIYFSSNGGSSFVKVLNLNGSSYSNNTWNSFNLDVDQLAASAGLSLTGTFVIKFQQYDNYAITTDGFAFDDISVTEAVLPPPVAEFSANPTAGTVPLAVQFADLSTNGPTSWSWNFGDQGTSTAQNPSHSYTAAGTYTVTLTATNAAGSDQETKVDYITVSEPGSWATITYDDFESGWGSYTDGGGDCSRYTRGTYAWQGSAAADIQDNSGVSSSFYHTGSYNVTGYNTLEVEFYFIAVSMENNEDFWVQYYNGSAWYTVASYARGVNFNNNTWYVATVTIPRSSYTFPTNAKIRFMCDASGNSDDVYIDAITFRGTASVLSAELVAEVRERTDVPAPAASGPETPEVEATALLQNHPNPFNPRTTIGFTLTEESHVTVTVFDVSGKRVATLLDETKGIGLYTVGFDAAGLASGIYFYRLQAGDFVQQRKMVLLK